MAERAEVTFDELRAARQELNDELVTHSASVRRFKHPKHPWFLLGLHEEPVDVVLRHLTSTATCLESLNDVPEYLEESERARQERRAADENLVAAFSDTALKAPHDRWQSDQAARVYCRVRTLAPILRLAPTSVLAPHSTAIREHIEFVWERVKPAESGSQGVSEMPEKEDERKRERATYPPNAFHTFWAVRLLDEYARHDGLDPLDAALAEKRATAELWTRQTLAAQSALIGSDAEHVDAHQLAWALSLEFRQTAVRPITASSPRLELYRAALQAFFKEQAPSGGWPLYAPLFHYPAAGNAYCYTFETLTELLRPALHERHGIVLRQLLRPHLGDLLAAWRFAQRTAIETGVGTVGWSSGHHPHRTDAEAWATAEVLSFMQALRRLVGHWTSELAARELRARRPRTATPAVAEATLRERGDTWTQPNEWTLGRRLSALFLHPLHALFESSDDIDPDRPLISSGDQEQARAAILFGPPGASKTTLVESLAGAMDWQFVEIHAATFLSSGMDEVPAQADRLFSRLMELDRCVVLFDEIDELIRQRQGAESDPFGRFLTTSMLPKLAKLWEQRRILYFVATNDIDAADPAIKRSQRFDAAIFAAPPSFVVKAKLLRKVLGLLPTSLTYSSVSDALSREWSQDHALGVFALLRYDQVPELAERLLPHVTDGDVREDDLKKVLFELGKGLQELEWKWEPENGTAADRNPFKLYYHLRKAERRDARMLQLLTIDPPPDPDAVPAGVVPYGQNGRAYFRIVHPLETIAATVAEGRWQLALNEGGTAVDAGLLDFSGLPEEAEQGGAG